MTTEDIKKRYERAQALEQGIPRVAFNTTLYPHWAGESDIFWYVRDKKTGQGADAAFGKEYRIVDAAAGQNKLAFDHECLALALNTASGHSVNAACLPLSDLDFEGNLQQFCFTAFRKRWRYDAKHQVCREMSANPESWKFSPDGKKALFSRDYNLWVKDIASGEERALTQDGERFNVYAGTATVYGRQEAVSLEALWSPDSKRVFTQVIDTRNVSKGAPLIEHVPADGSIRPKIINPERRVALAGDEEIEAYRFLAIDVDTGHNQFADYPSCPVCYPPYAGYFTGRRGWWGADNRYAYFIDQMRGGKKINLVKFDTHTGATQLLIEEASDDGVNLIPTTHIHTLIEPLPATNELIWYSERSGWAHFYLYELSSGRLKNPITQGDWLVRNTLHFDAARRELWIQTAGREKGRNPYYCDICRVNIDSGQLTTVVSTDHEYVVCDQRSRISFMHPKSTGVSPCGQYIVTTRSRVDDIPVSLLLDRNGNEILTIETANVSGLPKNWQWPEPVMLKAADGETDIYAVVFRPSDFDPKKSYPILDCTYYYTVPAGAFTNNYSGIKHYLSAAAYAELGFIVVMANNRGNEGLRDKAFNTYQDPILPLDYSSMLKYNKADCVSAIKQLAERYAYMDINRVGVAGYTSVPNSLAAMLTYPNFYKVGVCHNQMLDMRLMTSIGMSKNVADAPQLETLAGNLRGKLLLIAGMMDEVVPVAMTFRIAEALQQANKRFDMLILPNLNHTSPGYPRKCAWDYFVEHLLGVEPPDDFQLINSMDLWKPASVEKS